MPMMGGADYLGPEMNGDTYRFKFMQNGRVIWVDVDGQGRVIRRSRRPLIGSCRLTFRLRLPVVSLKQLLVARRVDGAKMNSSGEHRCVS